jgi:dipeptidyl aminopeptidase/acylaminoacyl peptidase
MLNCGKFIFDLKLPQDEVADPDALGVEATNPFSEGLLKMVKRDGVKRIEEYAISPLGDRLVFVGDFGRDEGPVAERWKPDADLWIVKLDGTGLRRLTYDRCNYVPAWSPSGNEIAFGHCDSVNVIDVRTGRERSLPGLCIYVPPEGRNAHRAARYLRPHWSPDGKVIAAEGEGLSRWVAAVEATTGKLIFETSRTWGPCEWGPGGELITRSCGTLVFDWDQQGTR